MSATPYVLIGAGGHAAVLMECLTAAGLPPPVAVLDADAARHGTNFFGVMIVGSDDLLPTYAVRGISHFVLGIGSAGSTHIRERLFARAVEQGAVPLAVVHPTSFVSPTAQLGPGVQLLPRSIVHTRATIGDGVIVNTGAIVEHDCRIEPLVHLATGSVLAGGVTVGRAAHIGAGAVVRQGIEIGPGAVVGAGAVVVKNVPAGAVVAGVPARVLKYLDANLPSA